MNAFSGHTVRVRVPATSANLGPGFDCFGLALQLHNFVSICASSTRQNQVTAEGEGAQSLGEVESNIAFIAVQHLCKHLQVDFGPIHLSLQNQIPFARGLGSSSAARIGALVAANEWAKCRFNQAASREELLNLAAALEGHPDNVAAALLGGLTVAALRENQMVSQPFAVKFWPQFAVFIPDEKLETEKARSVLPSQISRADAIFNLSAATLLLSALQNGDWNALCLALQDRWHQPFRAPLIPAFAILHSLTARADVLGVTISGAGPSVLLWLHPDAAALQVLAEIQNVAASHKISGRALELKVDIQGCVVV